MKKLLPACVLLFYISCSNTSSEKYLFKVKNTLEVKRVYETVEIDLHSTLFDEEDKLRTKSFAVVDRATKKTLRSQMIDIDDDGKWDRIIFQPEILPLSERFYEIIASNALNEAPRDTLCYSRFVPERTDDYAWENNKVAFRTFGPMAQRMKKNNIPGGTLSSGIDAWLKKVEYPILNKWYKKELETDGTYHEDNGEGLDNFHVGVSRGVGGTAIKKDSIYYVSENFVEWKTLYNGPIRTHFILNYAHWDANGKTIKEEKHITLDYGSNLSRFEVHITGADTLSVGLTLHEIDGIVNADTNAAYVSYWQPHHDSELGTGIVATKNTMLSYEKFESQEADKSNVYAHLKAINGKVIFYAGFGWKESGEFTNRAQWENYLDLYAVKINNPLVLVFED